MSHLKLIYIVFVTSLTAFLFSSCSITDYQDGKSLKIFVNFPKRSTADFNRKPAGTGDDYVPSFVDKIELTYGSEIVPSRTTTNLRGQTERLNEFDLGQLPWDKGYFFEIRAYSQNTRNSQSDPFIQTHHGSVKQVTIGVRSENTAFFVEAESSSADSSIDLDPDIPLTFSGPLAIYYGQYSPILIYPYCTAIDSTGNFIVFAPDYVSETYSITAHYFNSHGENIYIDDILRSFPKDNEKLLVFRSCSFFNDSFILPYFQKNGTAYDLKLINFRIDGATTLLIDSGLDVFDYYGLHYDMDSANERMVISWIDNLRKAHIRVLDASFNVIDGFEISEGVYSFPKIKIIEENSYLITLLNGTSLIGKIHGKDENFSDLAPFTTIPQAFRYSLDSTPDGFVVIHETIDGGNIQRLKLDQDLNVADSSALLRSSLNLGNQAQPFFRLSRDIKPVAVWSDDRVDSLFNAHYSVLDDSLTAPQIDIPFPVSQQGTYGAGEPRIAVNDDGLGFVSWINLNGKYYIKRYLF